ncbi:hypothetical protein [Calycomorphotria hydatis]|uniref:hypothetical protein n=1 Tax=Calycomorphotria hydatis TaxID=2528027 RepID=UPI0011A0FD64|nr:hypothetical protein [Calycomorphotria hydatis]
MEPTFFRMNTDRQRMPMMLDGSVTSGFPSACWLVCGGPSLKVLLIDLITQSTAPVMSVNLAGHGLIRPNYWTAYDPTCRFLRSIYCDAGIMKFVRASRCMDLVPETTYKVCDCPNMFFFEAEFDRNFSNFLSRESNKLIDWSDSMLQAIDILYRLGFRTIYVVGADLFVQPSAEQIEAAKDVGIEYHPANFSIPS